MKNIQYFGHSFMRKLNLGIHWLLVDGNKEHPNKVIVYLQFAEYALFILIIENDATDNNESDNG